MFINQKLSKEMKQSMVNFVLYPEKTLDSMSKYKDNFKIMEILSMMYGKSSILDKDMWSNLNGFSNLEEAKEFLKGIIQSSNVTEDCEMSNLLFLYGCVVVHEDNLKKGRYSFDFEN